MENKREQLLKQAEQFHQEALKVSNEKDFWVDANIQKYQDFRKTKAYKQFVAKIYDLVKKEKEARYQIELLEGKVWDNEKWATSFSASDSVSLQNARDKLADMLSQMNGVEIENNKGVKVVYITTKNKVYRYEIRAHYCNEVVGTKVIKTPFGEMEQHTYKQAYYASLKPSGYGKDAQNWSWR